MKPGFFEAVMKILNERPDDVLYPLQHLDEVRALIDMKKELEQLLEEMKKKSENKKEDSD